MQLSAGQRISLSDENKFLYIVSGKVEVYAVTDVDVSFRQKFLIAVDGGGAVFPSMDELSDIHIVVAAVEDVVMEERPFALEKVDSLRPLMKRWFEKLIMIPWLQLLADKGDETLLAWRNGSVLNDSTDLDALMLEFVDNEALLSMFLSKQAYCADLLRRAICNCVWSICLPIGIRVIRECS